MKLLPLIILLIKDISAQDDGILCSARTCSDYISENPCSSIPDECNIQNSTNNGIFLPSPDPCNCCTFCLINSKEGDYCSIGESGGLVPDSICGPGLYCSDVTSTCVKMTEIKEPPPCSKAQAEYDQRRKDGVLGSMEIRPECDDDGYFKPYKCVLGQTCFCVDKNGERIFGEIPYTSIANLRLKCECSRKYKDILKFFDVEDLEPDQHFRCAENGDYDTIQCIGEQCMCTDSSDGAPTYPTAATVRMSQISKTTLPDCFKTDVHLTGKYYYPCAEEYLKVAAEIDRYKAEGYDTVFNVEYPKCDLNGKYSAVQKGTRRIDGTTSEYYYCADFDGIPIGTYEAAEEEGMDCNCARSSLLISEDALEKLTCCPNGNFNPVQCRRGKCYCVDSDGYQKMGTGDTTSEAIFDEVETLFCYADACLGTSE